MLIGVDCDLHELTWWAEDGASQQGKPALTVPALSQKLLELDDSLVLYEIAGAVDYTDHKGAAHNKRRWTIFNVAMAGHLDNLFNHGLMFRHKFLVSPSGGENGGWTKGYPEKQRHALHGCNGRTHDIRECQCMVRMYLRNPEAWKPLTTYLAEL